MRNRLFLITTLIVLAAPSAWATTKFQTNLSPAPADCFSGGGFCLNVDSGCSIDNSECALGTMSEKSSVKIDSKLSLKAKFLGVTDAAGALLTTGPLETATNNLLLKVSLSNCPVDNGVAACGQLTTTLYLKVVLTAGKGMLKLDLAPTLSTMPGPAWGILGVELTGANANCAGDNSSANITARINDSANCATGVVRGSVSLIPQ